VGWCGAEASVASAHQQFVQQQASQNACAAPHGPLARCGNAHKAQESTAGWRRATVDDDLSAAGMGQVVCSSALVAGRE